MILAIIFSFTIILILPLRFKVKSLLSLKDKKLYYSITLYKLLKINCGYVDFSSASIKLNYSNNKIKFLTINDLIPSSDSVNFIRHFSFLKLSSAVLLGEDAEEYKIYLTALINSLNPVIYMVISKFHPYIKFKNDIFLLGDNSTSGSALELVVLTNLISVLSILIKKCIKKIIGDSNAQRKSKQ